MNLFLPGWEWMSFAVYDVSSLIDTRKFLFRKSLHQVLYSLYQLWITYVWDEKLCYRRLFFLKVLCLVFCYIATWTHAWFLTWIFPFSLFLIFLKGLYNTTFLCQCENHAPLGYYLTEVVFKDFTLSSLWANFMADILNLREYDRSIQAKQERLGLVASEDSDNSFTSSSKRCCLTGSRAKPYVRFKD